MANFTLIAKKSMTVTTDKGDYKIGLRERLDVIKTQTITMFDKDYIQITFLKGKTKRTFNVLSTSFISLFI